MVKVSYPLLLTVSPSTSGSISVTTVPSGRKLKLTRVQVHFPSGTEGKLLVRVMKGIFSAVPRTGYIAGDDTTVTVESDVVYESGSEVKVEYSNQDDTYSKSCFILIEGELE